MARCDAAPVKVTIIHVYATTSSSSEEDIEAFYGSTENALTKIHKKDVVIIREDWNAKVGCCKVNWISVM
jgi:hypothetical protein